MPVTRISAPTGSLSDASLRPDKGRAAPLYEQVRTEILRRLVSGHWKPGEVLPNEFDLATEFGVSQGTVRRALGEMAARNLVTRVQGRGTFVREYDSRWALFHFFHLVEANGTRHEPTTQLISRDLRPAGPDAARHLGIDPQDMTTWMERVRYLNGRPVIYETVVVPDAVFPGLGVVNTIPGSIYVLYEQFYGVLISTAEEDLAAVPAPAEAARHLGVPENTPMLAVERVACALDGRRVEWRLSLCDTRDHRYRTHLGG